MDPRPSAGWGTGARLTRQFALLSLIVIGLITAALCVVIASALHKDLLEREWLITSDFIGTEARYHLRPSDFAAPATAEARARFATFYEQTVMMPEIVRVKIYDAGLAVVWSDEPRLIGQRFPDNPHLRGAVDGRTTVNVEIGGRKGENIYEGKQLGQLVEVYVPIRFPGSDTVAGVVETYKAPTQVFANIRRSQLIVLGTALAGSAVLYLSLFWIVRRAGRRIDEQHRTLENRGRELASANQELQAVQGQLLETERMAAIGEVVTAVAHGIRNPLANIRAAAQVATLACEASPPARRNLTNIMAEVDRLESRLKGLLGFVGPPARQGGVVDVNAVLRGAMQMVAGRVGETGVKVNERLEPGLPPIVADAILLEQVFLSLLGNAIDAAAEARGTITVTTGVERPDGAPPRVVIRVADLGPGIAEAALGKIFEPFYTTKAQGTGLGLAIAKKFTEAYGGTISVSSRMGEGAVFRVAFPAAGD